MIECNRDKLVYNTHCKSNILFNFFIHHTTFKVKGKAKKARGVSPVARYDPHAMSRITDIIRSGGIVDDSSTSSSNDSEHGDVSDRRGSDLIGKITNTSKSTEERGVVGGGKSISQAYMHTILVAMVGIIVGASVAIGYIVMSKSNYGPHLTGSARNSFQVRAAPVDQSEQELLELAELIFYE